MDNNTGLVCVSEEEGNVELQNQDGSPVRNGMEDVAEQRGTERALQAVAAGQQHAYKRVGRRRSPALLAGTCHDGGEHGERQNGWANSKGGDEEVGSAGSDKVAGADKCLDYEVVVAGPHRVGSPEVFSVVEELGEERFHHSGVAEGADSAVGDGDEEDGDEKVDVAGLEKEAFHDDSRAIPHGVSGNGSEMKSLVEAWTKSIII